MKTLLLSLHRWLALLLTPLQPYPGRLTPQSGRLVVATGLLHRDLFD